MKTSLFSILPLGLLALFFFKPEHQVSSPETHQGKLSECCTASPTDTLAEPCGADHFHQYALDVDPGYFQKNKLYQKQYVQTMQGDSPSVAGGAGHAPVLYTLPIVVHIVHDNGAENITDAQVLQGISDLNLAFANMGFYDQGTGVDTEIQFCLAKQDPDGNLTTGINRVQSPLTVVTFDTDIDLKNLIRWDPLRYINIWLVRNAAGYAGYAYLPGAHGSDVDGIVENASVFGSTYENSVTTAHEMGHYLGLSHTWQGGCQNDDCLEDGDFVCDTPPDQSTAGVPCGTTMNTCDTDTNSGFTTDQVDMTWNYMDYASNQCMHAFTQGQTDRMHFFIDNVRFSLLDSEACNDPCNSDILADFSATANPIYAGESVDFINSSQNATTYDWQIDGTNFSTDENPSLNFDTPGEYEIILTTFNADPNCVSRDTTTITVECPVEANFGVGSIFPVLGENLNFINTTAAALGILPDYEWTVNGFSESTDQNFSYTFDISGEYEVCLTATGPLCDDAHCQTFLVFDDSVGCESTFIKTFGTQGAEEDGWVVTESDNGGFFLAGGQGEQTLIMKITPSGSLAWSRTFDFCPENDFLQFLELDSEGYLIGSGYSRTGPLSEGPNFVFRYDHINDQFLWVKNLDWPNTSRFFGMLENPDNENFFVTGQVANLSGSGCDGLIMELNRNSGEAIWMKRYHLGSCETFFKSTIVDGDIFVAGRYNIYVGQTYRERGGVSRIDFEGNEIWTRTYLRPLLNAQARLYANGLVQDGVNLVVASQGDMNGTSLVNKTVQLYSINLDGDIAWGVDFEVQGGESETVTDLVNLPDGYLMLGHYESNTLGAQIYLLKTDKDGNLQWARQYGGSGDEYSASVLVDNGFIHLLGRGGPASDGDFYFAKLDLEGMTLDSCDQILDLPVAETDIVDPDDGPTDLEEIEEAYDLYDFAVSSTPAGTLQEENVCGSLCTEVCANGVDDDNDGYVDCFDSDCPCNPDDCLVYDFEEGFATQLAWQSESDNSSVSATPIVANLNPQVDSIPEIITVQGGEYPDGVSQSLLIFQGDGSNAGAPDILPLANGITASLPPSPAVGDVNRDGTPDLVVVEADSRLRVYSNYSAGNPIPMQEIAVSTDLVTSPRQLPSLADFNSDGISEIYVGNDVFSFDFSVSPPALVKSLTGFGHDGGANHPILEGVTSSVAVDLLTPEECNGDPDCNGLELAAGAYIYSIDLKNSDGDGYEIKVQRNLNMMQSQFIYSDGFTSAGDINLDGVMDVVVSSNRDLEQGTYVYDKDGLVAWFPSSSDLVLSQPCIANVYDDTQFGAVVDMPEIISAGAYHLDCYNLQAALAGLPDNAWWSLDTDEGSGGTSPTTFDIDGNGLDEVIYRDQNNLRIIYGGQAPFPAGVDAERNWDTFTCGSYSAVEHPVVADVDFDRQAEIVTVGFDFPGFGVSIDHTDAYLQVFEADLTNDAPWLSARPIWNQYNYFAVNVNDDLSLPIEQQPHLVEFPDPGTGYRPLNKFLAQIPLLDNDFQPYQPVPDASVTVDTVICAGDSVTVTLTVCNFGSAPLPAEMPLTFYLGDPTATAATAYFTVLLGEELAIDSCLTANVNVPTFSGDVYLVANDDGSASTPYDLTADFPVTGLQECDFENNLTEYFFNYIPPPPPDLGPDFDFCLNGVFTLDAGPGWASYQWQDGSFEQMFTGFMTGTYWVVVTDDCGSTFTDTVIVTEDVAAQFDLGPDTQICPGDSLSFSVPGFVDFEWIPSDFLDCDTCQTVTATPLESTIYAVLATDADGCVGVDSIEIEVLAPTLFDTLGICAGDSVLIFGNYQSVSGTYSGTLPGPGNCDTLVLVTLEVAPQIELDMLTQDACEDQQNGNVGVDITFGVAPFDYEWSTGETTSEISGLWPGDYSLTVTDSDGCTGTGSIALGEIDANDVTLETQDATCFGYTDGQVTMLDFVPGTNFSFDGINFTQDSFFVNIPAGEYTLHVQDPSGCVFQREISIGQPPEITVTLPADVTIELGDSVALASQVNTLDSLSYFWSPSDWLSCNDCPRPWAAPFESTLYTLTVTDPANCSGLADVQVSVLRNLNVYVPNVFSPNGDGVNDNFTVFAGTGVQRVRRLLVFDRWGAQVFENYNFPPNDPSRGWDGTFKSEILNPAVFTWLAEIELVDGAVELMSGDVMLLR